ncbi:Zinc finger protein [Trichinella pseudospiralis]|uniref:Zinc finger protein n=1 Tax=Trichinella pseudospiralis TaxID=6337 RepID=A0A0V1JQD1_TRIPS|nr:Zinc finger protein [Trichinella pseudospiralis]KRZ37194.1 Zinc finger protein [Trichinella pseudospiralis]
MFNLSRVQYNDHINIHLGIRPFRCKKCNKCYNNRGAYHNHMRIHGNERLYICPLCKSDFLWEASLKWHLNVHKNKGEITAQMARQMYEGTMNVVRLKKKQLKITAQQKKENHTSHPIKKTSPPNFPPYNCYKQQCTINKYDYGEKNPTNCELPRRNAIKNSYDYENTENDKYWMDEANAIHTNTEECFSQLANGSTNTKLNPKRPFQEGTNYLYQNYYHDQNNIAAPANKSLYNDTTEQFNYEGKNFLSIDGTDNQERYLKPGGNYSIHQFDEKDCFFESINQNECPAKANRQVSSLVDKESEEKDLLALAMEILYETVPRETKCEEKENFPTMDNANNIKCSEKDWGNNIIQQSVETNCPFESKCPKQLYKTSTAVNSHIPPYNNDNVSQEDHRHQYNIENEKHQDVATNNYIQIKNENMDITYQNGFNAEIQRCHNTSLNNKQENKAWITSAMEVLYNIKAEDYKANTNFATLDNGESIHEISEYYKTPKQDTEYHFQNFHEQPSGSLHLNEEFQTEYSPNFDRIYDNSMTKKFHQIPPNMTTQQHLHSQHPQQLFHDTFAKQYNLQNTNAPCSTTDHAYNTNYGYYQQNLQQGAFNQQFIPQPEGNPYYENNLQAVYANKTVDPLSNYWQPQISSPQGTFSQQFIPQPEERTSRFKPLLSFRLLSNKRSPTVMEFSENECLHVYVLSVIIKV